MGKAQSLRNRVRSYWQKQSGPRRGPPDPPGHRPRGRPRDDPDRLGVSEALLLEANLIKRYQPRFNVRLKDDKSYPYIKVTLGDDFPRIERTRKLPDDGSRYFGPYASASSVDEAMNLVRRLFPFRTCTIDISEGKRALARPCLLYHIKRCQGPCIEAIAKRRLPARDIAQVELFLEGNARTPLVAGARAARWSSPSERTEYERAAVLRDKIRAIERTMESQKMAAFARTELDLVGAGAPGRPGGRPAVRRPQRQDGRARRVPPRGAAGTCPTTRCSPASCEQYYARAATRPARGAGAAAAAAGHGGPGGVPGGPTRRTGSPARAPARREARAAGAGRPATPPRRWRASRPAGWPTRARRSARSRSWPTRSAWPARRCGSSATTSATSRARESVGEHGRVRGGPAADRRVPALPDQDRRGAQRLRQPPGGAPPPVPPGGRAEEGSAEERRWAMPDLVIVDGGQGPGECRRRGPRRAGPRRPAAGRPGQGARGAVPARPVRADPAAADLAGALPRPAAARRGPPVRDHVPPRPAGQGAIQSAFDDLPGVGPKRKRALLQVFGSARRVREAPVEQIAAVPGIGARWRTGSRPPWRPTGHRPVPAIVRRDAQSRSYPHPDHRRSPPSSSTSGRPSSCPPWVARARPPGSSRRSSASTSRAACGSSTRPFRTTEWPPTPMR